VGRLDVVAVERPAAFQEPLTAEQIEAMCRGAFGDDVRPVLAVELGLGAYNTTYRVDLGNERQVILRVAPRPDRQYRTERELMRNEHAAEPFLAPIAALMPRTLAVDFGHHIVDRDYLFQTVLDGVPAPDGLAAYPRSEWAGFFRRLGTITRAIHDVRGERFGTVAGTAFATWSDALVDFFEAAAADLDDAGLDARDVREIAALAQSTAGLSTRSASRGCCTATCGRST
jgi:hypothetical protein